MPGATPDNQNIKSLEGDFELVSLVGTLSQEGSHLHISVSDTEGNVLGGHLKSGIVRMTAEVVIGDQAGSHFKRALDEETNFPQLEVQEL